MENNSNFAKKLKERFKTVNEQIDLVKALGMLYDSENDMKNQKQLRDEMVSTLASNIGLGDEQKGVELLEKLKAIGVDKLNECSEEELKNILKESGYVDLVEGLDPYKFLECIVDTINTLDELDKSIENYKTEMDNMRKELDSHQGGFADVNNLLLSNLNELLEEEHSKAVEIAIKEQISSIENAISLQPIIDLYNAIGGKNTRKEYMFADRRSPNLTKYNDTLRRLKIKSSLLKFIRSDVNQYLKEEYQELPKGFLIYAIMKYIGGRSFSSSRHDLGMFLTQLNINFYQLFTNTLSEENKAIFIDSLNKLASLFV